MVVSGDKELIWVGSSLKDLREFPEDVRQVMGFALYLAQVGEKHPDAKPLKGFLAQAYSKWWTASTETRTGRFTQFGSPMPSTSCTRFRRSRSVESGRPGMWWR
jgi:hypothetical protein